MKPPICTHAGVVSQDVPLLPRGRDENHPAFQQHHPRAMAGMTLEKVRLAHTEILLTFRPPATNDEFHLIARPEGIVDPLTRDVRVTGMKYETGDGPLLSTEMLFELAGEASEVIGKQVLDATLNPDSQMFGIQLTDGYSIVLTPQVGLDVLHTRKLQHDFRAPVKIV
jgi:hypothetical protein